MKSIQSTRSGVVPESSSARLGRRDLVVGAGVAGAAAIAAQALLRGAADVPAAGVVKTVVAEGEGYRLTPHVLRYYETTKA